MPYILIFKTNIEHELDLFQLEDLFKNIPSITNWNVDREDVDKVLRVESLNNKVTEIISSIKNLGYLCEELKD
ncbi:MAG: hypothetical protein LCH32_00065 [Bacteroidetes bacterium]|nr:hypothetical protein [Bacteroidota bacterium]